MKVKEKINIVYIDDDCDEAISEYLEDYYKNDDYDIEYLEVRFDENKGYENLLNSSEVALANVIIIDSKLFENNTIAKNEGKFYGEEFKMILRKIFPFIEVLVISQNGEDKDFDIIPKYRSNSTETSREYYDKNLKIKINESIERIITFRNISKKLENNTGIEKFLVEKTISSLNGINDYENLSKNDIDKLLEAFQKIEQERW